MLMVSTHPDFNKLVVSTTLMDITVLEIDDYAVSRNVSLVGASGSFTQEGKFEPEYFIGVDNDGEYKKLAVMQRFFIFNTVVDEVITDEMLIAALDSEVKGVYA